MLLLIISLMAGLLTILAPCVLPVLPIIIGGSIGGDSHEKARPYIIGASLAGSIIFFTLLLKFSTALINLPPDVLNWISGSILIALGVASVWPELWERLVIRFNWQAASQRWLGKSEQNRGKYTGPVLTGIALGPVFASCSPTYAFILASVLPSSFGAGLIYLLAYSLGLMVALLAVSLVGRKFIKNLAWAVDTHSLFRRLIGGLFIIIGLVIFGGYQIRIETWVANHLPFDETRIERVLLTKQSKSPLKSTHTVNDTVLNVPSTPAPELAGLTNWINSSTQTLAGLKGKVVLVDFWTYSCINCIRSIPFVENWYQTYHDKGFVVLGINTPEFAFEHNPSNVAAAVKKFGITYPVALDNNYATWNAFNNNSWPADYLIDQSGNVRYVSLGEGDYDKTEQAIQALLGVKRPIKTGGYTVPITQTQTPETYFGSARRTDFSGKSASKANADGSYTFTPTDSSQLAANAWTLSGNWVTTDQAITSKSADATLTFNVGAKDVYMVASTNDTAGATVGVSLPSANAGQFGSDAPDGTATVNGSRLYHIVALPRAGSTTVRLIVPKGVSLYTFTFGS